MIQMRIEVSFFKKPEVSISLLFGGVQLIETAALLRWAPPGTFGGRPGMPIVFFQLESAVK